MEEWGQEAAEQKLPLAVEPLISPLVYAPVQSSDKPHLIMLIQLIFPY